MSAEKSVRACAVDGPNRVAEVLPDLSRGLVERFGAAIVGQIDDARAALLVDDAIHIRQE